MKLYSRLNGEYLNLAQINTIPSGLFVLEEGSKSARTKTILFDNGTGTYSNGSLTLTLTKKEKTEEHKNEIEVLKINYDAIEYINDKFYRSNISVFSHLLPPEIINAAALSTLDNAIERAFDNGVLHSINQKPRMSMRYDVELLPTSRVKRNASNYQAHLVAHSECWQQRTLTGIIPKKLLAKVSEDEVQIYENIVYARLIDNLLGYLAGFQARLKKILDVIEEFEKLDAKDKVHHYINQITNDWGRAFYESNVEALKEQNQHQLDFVTAHRARLTQLKNATLYRLISPHINIGIALKSTNILMHDDNYRRMADLWRVWSKSSTEERISPAQLEGIKLKQQQQYTAYVEKILHQVFTDIGWQISSEKKELMLFSGLSIDIQTDELGVWELIHDGKLILRIIALAEPLIKSSNAIEDDVFSANGKPIVLTSPQISSSFSGVELVELSPLNLYAKEIFSTIIVKSIWKWCLSVFNEKLPEKLPNLIKQEVQTNHRLLQPLDLHKMKLITEQSNKVLSNVIKAKSAISRLIRCCPYCIDEVEIRSFTINENGDFKGNCSNKECQSVWVHRPAQKQYFIVNHGGNDEGRYSFTLDD